MHILNKDLEKLSALKIIEIGEDGHIHNLEHLRSLDLDSDHEHHRFMRAGSGGGSDEDDSDGREDDDNTDAQPECDERCL